jgi:hypothetical protein
MTDLYAPNQQVVRGDGSGPAEQGTGGSERVDPEPVQKPVTDELDELTKDELLDRADALGVEADRTMNKAEIKEAIRGG